MTKSHGLLILISFALLAVSGCWTIPPGSGLSSAIPVSDTIDKKAWISKVRIHDPSVGDNSHLVEDSLTLNLLEYLHESRYFREVNLLPGEVGTEDLILHFHFDVYKLQRSPYYDRLKLSGRLLVEDAKGSSLTEVSSQVNERLPSQSSIIPTGIESRTFVVKELVNKAILSIRQGDVGK